LIKQASEMIFKPNKFYGREMEEKPQNAQIEKKHFHRNPLNQEIFQVS
jgi:hypothetical protein